MWRQAIIVLQVGRAWQASEKRTCYFFWKSRLSPGMLPCSKNQFAEARLGAGYRPTFQRNWKIRYFLPL
jgi:hypothetical protein